MANPENKQLAVDVIARIEKLERGMAKAAQTVNRQSAQMEGRLKKFGSNAERIAGGAATKLATIFSRLGVAGLAGGGVAGLAAGFAQVAKSVAEVGDAARMAGMSSKAFQEWKYVAEQARIPVDAVTDGLKELSLRADEFATTGKGSAAEAFGRLGLSKEEVKERLKDPSELMLLIIERTRQLKDTAAGIRIFDELLGGTGGERMVSLLDQGEVAIRDQIKAANDLGLVMDEKVIAAAAELDAKFNTIVTTVGTNLKAAIVSAADSLVDFINQFRDFENQRTSSLEKRQAAIGLERLDLENQSLSLKGGDGLSSVANDLGFANDSAPINASALAEIKKRIAALNEEEAQIVEVLSQRTKLNEATKPTDRTFTPIDTGGGGGKKRDKAAAQAEREAEAVRRLIAELDHEYSLIGKSALEQQKMNALRQAGSAATAEQRAAILSKVEAIYRESEAHEKLQQATRDAQDAARDFAGTLVDGFINGASATETLANALKNLGSRLANSGLDALFGGLFGGGGCFGGAAVITNFSGGAR